MAELAKVIADVHLNVETYKTRNTCNHLGGEGEAAGQVAEARQQALLRPRVGVRRRLLRGAAWRGRWTRSRRGGERVDCTQRKAPPSK